MGLIQRRAGILLASVCAAVLFATSFRAAQQTPLDYAALFDKREAMIAMRDGVKLYTEIY